MTAYVVLLYGEAKPESLTLARKNPKKTLKLTRGPWKPNLPAVRGASVPTIPGNGAVPRRVTL